MDRASSTSRSVLSLSILLCTSTVSSAGTIFGFSNAALGGGYRWDAAPRTISGRERSLAGGLRYSVQGQSAQAFRDLFTWSSVPTVPQFTTAVQQAFDAWSSVDPATSLTTALTFVPDFATAPVGSNTGSGGVNTAGAEIDLFGSTDAGFWNVGNSGTQGETRFSAIGSTVKLTSGTVGYAGGGAISGADIIMNSNPQAVYSLDLFRRILTHEIGHAIGLGDVEGSINPGAFIDDNFDNSTSATALATLTNSWAGLVNRLDPAASPLSRYTAPVANPGLTTPGVDILMESFGVGIGAGNPVTKLIPLANDDYGTRQFLYPAGRVGDFDVSSTINAVDIDLLALATPGVTPTTADTLYDVNRDGQVIKTPNTVGSDLDHLIRVILLTQYGDATLDQQVNFDDLLIVAQNYDSPTGGWASGNFDGINGVNFDDLLALAQNYNFGAPADLSSIASIDFQADWALAQSLVPEPTALSLIAIGAVLRRRRH